MTRITILLLFISLTGIAQKGRKNFIDQNYIHVTGTVESEIIPDEIYINITINERDKKGKVSVELQEAKMIQQLNIKGIDIQKKLSIENFNSIYDKFIFRKNDVLKVKQYTLLVHNTEQLEKVFNVFEQLEISNVYISKVDHSKMEDLKLEAKIKAIKIAKKKAKVYAEAIKQSVGRALFINEKTNHEHPSNNSLYGSRASNIIIRGYDSSLNKELKNNLNFKKIIISASIEAKFELQ